MFKFIHKFLGRRLRSSSFISDDPDKVELDVLRLMRDDDFMIELNVVILAYVVISRFEPEITTFVHAMRILNLTAQEYAIIMIRVGSAFQFLVEHKELAIRKAQEADFSMFPEETKKEIIDKLAKFKNSFSDEMSPEEGIVPKPMTKDLNQDELANKLIDDYLKGKKNKDKDKDN